MLFNSLTYWVFLVFAFVVYWWLNNRLAIQLRNVFLLFASYYFYASWDERFLLLIIASSIVDYLCGKFIFKSETQFKRKLFLAISIITNLGMLGFFKYYNFFIESFIDFATLWGFSANKNTLSIILPVGISFYTFQTLSYSIDIYKRKLEPVSNIISFFTFVAFFPQLVAGPIERAVNLLPQIQKRQQFDINLFSSGLRIILWGLFKKVVIADRLSFIVDRIFELPSEVSGLYLLIVAILFGIQIYCDFSGYSDIAIGSSRLLGIHLMDNFKQPYFSLSFKEFWQRWHISLSTWFRDYVYIPLGGSRKGKIRTNLNLMVTFVVSGLWHGANYTFLLWGFFHGFFLIIEKKFKLPQIKLVKLIYGILVFMLVNLLWIFFRAENIEQAWLIFKRIFMFTKADQFICDVAGLTDFKTNISLAAGLIVFVTGEYLLKSNGIDESVLSLKRTVRWGIYYFIVLMILIFGVLDIAPQFIYFQF